MASKRKPTVPSITLDPNSSVCLCILRSGDVPQFIEATAENIKQYLPKAYAAVQFDSLNKVYYYTKRLIDDNASTANASAAANPEKPPESHGNSQ